MSRIPVFIERSARKGWNTTVEPCIFIACDSVETSSEIGDILEPDVTLRDDIDEALDNFIATEEEINNFENSENRLIDKVQLNDTQESKLEGEDGNDDFNGVTQGNGRMAKVSSVTLTVVSCSKGVINSTCNCNNCNNGISMEEFVTGLEGENMKIKDPEVLNNGIRSLIPRPRRLTAGKVSVTPAPIKKSKTRPEKRQIPVQNERISTKQIIKAAGESNDKNGILQMNVVKGKGNKSEDIFDESSITNDTDKGKEESDALSDVKKQLIDNDIGEKSVNIEEKERTCTESGMFRSLQDHEDSEPEYAQHEMQKNENGSSVLQENLKQKPRQAVEVNSKFRNNQTVATLIHCESSVSKDTGYNDDKGAIRLVKAVTPQGSGIPRFQSRKFTDGNSSQSESKNLPRSQCVSVSSNYSVTPRTFSRASSRDSNSSRNSSVSPRRTQASSSVSFLYNSSRPSPRSKVSEKTNQVGVKDELSHNEKVKLGNSNKMVLLNTQKFHETKSSRLRRKSCSYSQENVSDNEVSHDMRRENSKRSVRVSGAVPTFTDDAKESMYQSRRNLPRAPSQIRKVRYGQRCIMEEEDVCEGEQYAQDIL